MEKIPFARPFMGSEEEDAVLRVLRSGWLTTGVEALAFEREFAAFLGGGESGGDGGGELKAFAVNSATSGLHLAVKAAGVGEGDVVLVPSLTFTATAEVVRYERADVAFVDVEKDGFLMDTEKLEATLARLQAGKTAYERGGPRGRPAAIMPVHYGGLPCDMEEIMRIARKYGAAVIEDAAHSFPSRLPNGVYAGCIGDAGVFSFYATKTLATGEGGMLVTRDDAVARSVSMLRSHGIDRPVFARYTDAKASWYYEVVEPGFKYNMPDLLAALGRVQLRRAQELLAMRREIARRYDDAFRGDGRFVIPPGGAANAYHLYPLRLRPDTPDTLDRAAFITMLRENGIGASVHFIPLHIMPYYRTRYDLCPGDFPETMRAYQHEVSLPIWPGLTQEMLTRITTTICHGGVTGAA
ncbi:MAG: DegT/DnrJ/EryC1/StrS family aminotransferase [Spirochaetaceae bacterium]|jgi:dTDP-4-amino-4,6-dideoxygalactose transaminase|nr:DegT/DnrJ/EryC1/StrS family aminotransferase [Spirochaetaceae bacterium]